MSADPPMWTELSFRSPASDPAASIATHLVPFLTGERAAGRMTRMLLLRELGRSDHPRIVVQVQTGLPGIGPTGPGLAACWREAARAAGFTDVTIGPAAEVPLAGSGFDGPSLGPSTRDFLAAVASVLLPLAGTTDRTARLAGALDLIAAHLPAVAAATVPGPRGGAPLSFLSLRSHAEAFFASTRDPVAARQVLNQRYEAVHDHLEQRVAGVVAQVRGTGAEVSPAARVWFDAAGTAKPGMAEEFRIGGLNVVTDDPPVAGGALDRSAFHRVIGSSALLRQFLSHDPEFLATRLLTSLLYLAFHTIGLSLVERYFLCHATSRACETLFEVDADTVVAALTRTSLPAHLSPAGSPPAWAARTPADVSSVGHPGPQRRAPARPRRPPAPGR